MGTFGGVLSGAEQAERVVRDADVMPWLKPEDLRLTDWPPEKYAAVRRNYATEKRRDIPRIKKQGHYLDYPVRMALVSELDDVYVKPHTYGRLVEALRAARDGIEVPPIAVSFDEDTGRRYITEGNHRLEAARRLGLKTIWTSFGPGADWSKR